MICISLDVSAFSPLLLQIYASTLLSTTRRGLWAYNKLTISWVGPVICSCCLCCRIPDIQMIQQDFSDQIRSPNTSRNGAIFFCEFEKTTINREFHKKVSKSKHYKKVECTIIKFNCYFLHFIICTYIIIL